MEPIRITDDHKEQAEIGKRIYENHPQQYPEKIRKYLSEHLNLYLPQASGQEREEALYRSVYDYWVYGNDIEEEFIYDFPHKTHAEKSRYITLRGKLEYFRILNDANDEKIFADKYRTYTIFKDAFRREVILLEGESDYQKFCDFTDRHAEFFVKPCSLALGIGVYRESISAWKNRRDLFERLLRHGEQGAEYRWSLGNKVVLEEPVEQAHEMALLHPSSVNVIRLATLLKDGETKFPFACLRIGINGSKTASASDKEIYCGVDLNTGIVDTDGITDLLEVYPRHPNTQIRFRGYCVPRWQELLSLAELVSKRVPTVRYVGWDFALSKDGWVVIEGNEHGDFVSQIAYGKPCRNEFEKLIGFTLTKAFWWE